ncbi:hypothetical protein AVEN_161482-1 [Araneus ventricosus]|uniref:Uncharacterized protein n=1 Tax=Araneus ventricosus TaxID=182803 RepID=A0A4Y2UBY0_ARAVE|nr:hypothetical protein AVEN_161482-1 [Araneus ventricosus]
MLQNRGSSFPCLQTLRTVSIEKKWNIDRGRKMALFRCWVSDPNSIFNKSEDEFISQGDASESGDNLEMKKVTLSVDSDEDDEFISTSERMWAISCPFCYPSPLVRGLPI